MKKCTLFIMLLVLTIISVKANTNSKTRNNEISFSFANSPLIHDWWFNKNILLFDLNYNRKINNYLSVGCYTGTGMYEVFKFAADANRASAELINSDGRSLNLGLNGSVHFLPLLLKTELNWVDLYINGKIGTISFLSTPGENIIPARGTYFDGSLMGGIKLYPSSSFGIFGEYGYRYFEYYKGLQSRFGIAIRF